MSKALVYNAARGGASSLHQGHLQYGHEHRETRRRHQLSLTLEKRFTPRREWREEKRMLTVGAKHAWGKENDAKSKESASSHALVAFEKCHSRAGLCRRNRCFTVFSNWDNYLGADPRFLETECCHTQLWNILIMYILKLNKILFILAFLITTVKASGMFLFGESGFLKILFYY